MPSERTDDLQPALTHVIYDRTTGRPVGRFRRFDVTGDACGEIPAEEVLALFGGDDGILTRVADGDPRNLAVVTAELPAATRLDTLRMSTKHSRLVERPRLRLRAEREVLEGDGEDSVTIHVELVDGRGKALRGDAERGVHLTTSRGKLSARGGRLILEQGVGSLTLTSVRETVDRVRLRARDPRGGAAGDEIVLRFE
jgi:hypothetical protein